MDFNYFFHLLLERKWLILSLTLLAGVVTFFVSQQSSQQFKSRALIATGITESKSPTAVIDQAVNTRPFEVENQFSNLSEMVYSKSVIGLLSKELVKHDLNSNKPFRDWSELREEYSDEQLLHALEILETKFNLDRREGAGAAGLSDQESRALLQRFEQGDTLSLGDFVPESAEEMETMGSTADEALLTSILRGMGYNYTALVESLIIYRVRSTDYMRFECVSENPELSAFVVNTLAEEFIRYYSRIKSERSDASVDFFTKLTFEKKQELDQRVNDLKAYKLEHRIINIEDQSSGRIGQIQTLELEREQENKRIPASMQAIRAIDRQLNSAEASAASLQANSRRVQNLREELTDLTNQAVAASAAGQDDTPIRRQMESKRRELNKVVEEIASEDKSLSSNTQSLLATRLNLEIDLEVARAGVNSIDRELARLKQSVGNFVEEDANIQAYEREISLVQEEYLDYVNKLNMAKLMALTSGNQITIIERGEVPDIPEASGAVKMAAFASAVAFAFTLALLFALAFFDMTLKSPSRFQMMTEVPLVGYLNQLKYDNLDLETFFNQKSHDKDLETFKQLLRKIRYQLEQNNAKRVLITSTRQQEGKSFLIISLAYSLSLNNKKVLIIDTNFKNNTLTEMLQTANQENLLANTKLIGDARLDDEFVTTGIINRTTHSGIDLIGSKGGYNSPSEIFAGKNFDKLLDSLELTYDYIFLEGSSINDYSDTQELVEYVDHVITVFSAESQLKAVDRQSLDFLQSLQEKFLGAVLNRVELKHTV
jgi:succinoglycan biosynthesis transport protein ExoP